MGVRRLGWGFSWLVLGLIVVEAVSVLFLSTGGTCPVKAVGWSGLGTGEERRAWVELDWSSMRVWAEMRAWMGEVRKAMLGWAFWKTWISYWTVVVFAPSFIATFLNLDCQEWNQLTFALARCALFLGFASVEGGKAPMFQYVCHELVWAINITLALDCFVRQRFARRAAMQPAL